MAAAVDATGTLAALAGLDLMTVARLHALLAHHEPDEAFAVAAGRAAPAPAVAAMMRPPRRGRVAGVGGAPRSRRRGRGVSRRSASSPSRARDAALPDAAARRSAAAGGAVRPRRPRRARRADAPASSARATPRRAAGTPRSGSAGRSPRPASPSCRGWPRASTARPTAARSPWPTAGPAAVVGNGPDRPYPRVHAELWARGLRARGAAVGVAARHAAGAVPVPDAQPHPRRAERGPRGRREPRAGRLADHRPGGARAVDRRHGRPGLAAQPGRGRHQPPAARRRGAGHRRRRRAGRARARHPAGRARRPSIRVRCRVASRPTCWRRAGTIRARWTTSSSALALPMADAAMALARLERTGWVRESGGWFEPVVSWSGR